MKKIKNSYYKIVSLIFIILSTNHYIYPQLLLGGSLQFAKHASLDDISICHYGNIITTQRHELTIPKITYEIARTSGQKKFYILITTAAIKTVLKEFPNQQEVQNTISYLKIDPSLEYLLYELELVADEMQTATNQPQTYHWVITESSLPETGQIPVETIIITYFPRFITAIKGGNHLELPTVYIDNSLTDSFGSQEDFEEALVTLQLSALNLNALHAPTKRKIKAESRRLLIMDTLA